MTRTVMMTVLAVGFLMGGSASAQQTVSEADAWRAFATALPTATSVAVRLKDGREFKGTIVEVRTEGLLFKPRTRIPVPAGEIRFADIDSIVRRHPGMSPGTKVVAGVGAAAGTILMIAVAALAASGY